MRGLRPYTKIFVKTLADHCNTKIFVQQLIGRSNLGRMVGARGAFFLISAKRLSRGLLRHERERMHVIGRAAEVRSCVTEGPKSVNCRLIR